MEKYPNLKIGDRVIRGPDWIWGEQDGFEENTDPLKYKGTIIKIYPGMKYNKDTKWYRVKWDYSLLNNLYYYDNDIGRHDIILCNKIKPINNNPINNNPINYNPKPFFNFNFDSISI